MGFFLPFALAMIGDALEIAVSAPCSIGALGRDMLLADARQAVELSTSQVTMVFVFISFSPWISWNYFDFQFKDARKGIFLEIQLFQNQRKSCSKEVKRSSRKRHEYPRRLP
jgi:hypothetical protein